MSMCAMRLGERLPKETLIFCVDCSMNLSATMSARLLRQLACKMSQHSQAEKQCGQIHTEDNEESEVFQGQ